MTQQKRNEAKVVFFVCGESNAIARGNWRNLGMIGYQIGRKIINKYMYIYKKIITFCFLCCFAKVCVKRREIFFLLIALTEVNDTGS